jgi:hypothetical protein
VKYQRPHSDARLTKQEKVELMRDYVEFYRRQYAINPATLNRKIPRSSFARATDAIGSLLLEMSAKLATTPGPVAEFLKDNPLPPFLSNKLPIETRAFCLALNALKQWVVAEQAAMDRLILGGSAREICRDATPNCLVTGQPLNRKTLNLHHPVRDGRPPLPLSKEGHDRIERQTSPTKGDGVMATLLKLRREGNQSWIQLRRGCLDLLGRDVAHSTKNVKANSRAFAKKAMKATNLNCDQLLDWLDQNGK